MRIDHYALGYRKISVADDERARALNILVKRGMSCKMRIDGSFYVSLLNAKRYENALAGVKHTVSDVCGIPAFFLKYRKRYGIIVGFLIAFVYILASTFFVWDIRIEGNETLSDLKIEEALEDHGFAVGSLWRGAGLSDVETDILASSSDIGWININRRGCVAYVTVKEKNTVANDGEKEFYSNVVAKEDCVITEITVKRGIACVKVGDTVKAGQLLISGVIPSDLGGGFVHAEGDVFGAVSEKIELTVPKVEYKNELSEPQLSGIYIKIFNFSIKLFKKYGKIDESCVIIEDMKEGVLFGKYRIPFGIRTEYLGYESEKSHAYTEKEMTEIAGERMRSLSRVRFIEADVLRLKTSGEFSAYGYTMTTYATVHKSIGEERPFSDEMHSSQGR